VTRKRTERGGCRGVGPTSVVLTLATLALALLPAGAQAGRKQWAMFEDPRGLVDSSPSRRAQVLKEVQLLGADTLRVQVRWSTTVPAPQARTKPRFDATDPAAYPGFGPYDDLIVRANALGMRILVTIAGDAPRWATDGGRGASFRTANWRPSATEYGIFAGAVARRYSGAFGGLPAVRWFSIWNEPNHVQFLKPTRDAPRLYRNMVDTAIPQIRRVGSGAQILVGDTAPVGRAGRAMGPKAFIRSWLCLTRSLRKSRRGNCRSFKRIDADGFAHHPYGPVDRVPARKDIINMLAIRVLAKYLDRAAKAKRLPRKLSIYGTEFGLQSNPPDTTVSTTPSSQARLINEKEEYSYRYGRLKSYSQYLLTDDPPRPGPRSARWSGFQTGLRFPNGKKKPAWNAYRFPIVVHRRRGGVRVWGCVRPGEGRRFIRLYANGRPSGGLKATNSQCYFSVKRRNIGRYRFKAYERDGNGTLLRLGTSRTARPIR
jgi:hypothetical protein